jgi:hypothetical protein
MDFKNILKSLIPNTFVVNKDHNETTIKELIQNFYKEAKDLKPVPNSDVICNQKVFTGFRCLTCESMDTDGSSKIRGLES